MDMTNKKITTLVVGDVAISEDILKRISDIYTPDKEDGTWTIKCRNPDSIIWTNKEVFCEWETMPDKKEG